MNRAAVFSNKLLSAREPFQLSEKLRPLISGAHRGMGPSFLTPHSTKGAPDPILDVSPPLTPFHFP